jgi:excisionase family DNA binding protein
MVHWDQSAKGIAQSVDDLLTTRQLQDLLQIDRVTIYRMLSDGRLRGFKVGGQWRFSRREIETWLQEQQSRLGVDSLPSLPEGAIAPSPHSLPLSCIQAIQSVCAEALDIAAVTAELDGTPLTDVSNSCGFCNLILSTGEGRSRCMAAWRLVGNGQVQSCHAGLLCVSAPIEVGGQPVAVTAGCQFVAPSSGREVQAWRANLPALAAGLDLGEQDLRAAADSVRVVSSATLPRVSRLLQQVADTFSEIGEERLNLLSRLQHIAEMSKI